MSLWTRIMRKIVQPDPHPEPSILDVLDASATPLYDEVVADHYSPLAEATAILRSADA